MRALQIGLLAGLAALGIVACDDGEADQEAGSGGISGAGGGGGPRPDAGPPDPTFASVLAEAGYTQQSGRAVAFRVEDCATLASCFGNNASSPYVLFTVPPAPGAALPDTSAFGDLSFLPDGQTPAWLLGPGEAIIISGRTPPVARYFSFAPYLFTRAGDAGPLTIFASLSDALNVANIRTAGDTPFASQFAMVLTADAGAEATARAALGVFGVPDAVINTMPLPSDTLRMGTTAEADSVMLLGRVALFEDPTAGGAWLDAPPLAVWRISPTEAAPAPTPLAVPERAERGTGTDESGLADALDALDAAIRATLEGRTVEPVTIAPAAAVTQLLSPETCIANGTNCLGEISDTVYSAGPISVVQGNGTLTLSDDPAEAFWVYGVNHEASGKATYSNVVVMWGDRQAGVLDIPSTQMAGSARALLPDHPDADRLFAFRVARACGDDDPWCRVLPSEFPGVPFDGNLLFVFRAYLEPGTDRSPGPTELLTERVLHVRP